MAPIQASELSAVWMGAFPFNDQRCLTLMVGMHISFLRLFF